MNPMENINKKKENKKFIFCAGDSTKEFEEMYKIFLNDRNMLENSQKSNISPVNFEISTPPSNENKVDSFSSKLSNLEEKNNFGRLKNDCKEINFLFKFNQQMVEKSINNKSEEKMITNYFSTFDPLKEIDEVSLYSDDYFEPAKKRPPISKYEIIPGRRVIMACIPENIYY